MANEPIRVLHFADVHIGVENYGRTHPESGLSTRVHDFLRQMDTMIDFAEEHGVDLSIFAGDAFKTRTPNPTYQREFARRIRRLSGLAPIVLLVGNHDMPPTDIKASSVEIYETLQVPNVYVAYSFDLDECVQVIPTQRGEVVVGTVPYPIRSRIAGEEAMAGKTIAEIDGAVQSALRRHLEAMAEKADEYGDIPRLLTGHFTVSGAKFGSERGIMLGRDIEVLPGDVADSRWDYVALGHIHKHQNLTEGRRGVPPVVYSGSIERIDFGEAADLKGFCWVELAREATTWRFYPLAARRFIQLNRDLSESTDPTFEVETWIKDHDLDEAVVKLRLKMTPEVEAKFNENAVRGMLLRAGTSFIAAIEKDVEQPSRTRLSDAPEGMTDDQLLESYLIARQSPPERRAALMREAETIFQGVKSEL